MAMIYPVRVWFFDKTGEELREPRHLVPAQ